MTSNSNIDELIAPVFKLGYEHSDKDYAELKQAIQQELLKARIDELNRYDTDEDMYKTLRTVDLQAKLKGDE